MKEKTSTKTIANAKVDWVKANGSGQLGSTNSEGIYRIEGLEVGDYKVIVSASGYKADKIGKIMTISVGKMASETFELELEPPLSIEPPNLNLTNTNNSATVIFTNKNAQNSVNLSIEVPQNDQWVKVRPTSLLIPAGSRKDVTVTVDGKGKSFGSHSSLVILNYTQNGTNFSDNINVNMIISSPNAPAVTTNPVNLSGITQTTANISCTLTNTGGSTVTQRGICWAEHNNPKPEADFKSNIGGGDIGSFVITANNLKEGKTYYVRAYAINAIETGLGNIEKFTTSTTPTPPSLTIGAATNINHNSALVSGKVTNNGGTNLTEQGFCWNTTGNPTIANNKTPASADNSGNFSYKINNSTTGITYFVRAYAINGLGDKNPGYSDEIKFSTEATFATLTTTSLTAETTSAKSRGNISSDGGANITNRGVCWDTKTNPTIDLATKTSDGTGTGEFVSNLANLNAGTTYHLRAYAINSKGISYGGEVSFTTKATPPTVTTTAISSITNKSAKSGGNITSSGGDITARGVCWGTNPNPTIVLNTKTSDGTGTGSFTSEITGLKATTKYYVRTYATNSAGTSYGNETNFTTPLPLVIGQECGGGIILYIDATGEHGLIVTKADVAEGVSWYNGSYVYTGATKREVGSGQENTNKIINALGKGKYAATICDDLALNGFEDWYLPSRDELDLVFKSANNLSILGYWTSTDVGNNGYGSTYYRHINFAGFGGLGHYNSIRAF